MSEKKCVNIAILTVSDTRTEADDKSGQVLVDRVQAAGHHLVEKKIIKDEIDMLQEQLKKWIASPDVDVVIATGGTGVTGRDITPEAFEELYEKSIPGFGELFRMLSFESIRTSSLQSRCTAGVANGTSFSLYRVPPGPARMDGTRFSSTSWTAPTNHVTWSN